MAKNNRKPVYRCKHCHTPWSEHYLADLCFKVDMDNLVKGKEDLKNAKDKIHRKKRT
jgi:hypothetical protein